MSTTDDHDDRQLARLLADPSLWLEPDPSLDDRVLAVIRAERESGSLQVVPLRSPRRWSTHVAAGLLGAAAAALIAVAVTRLSDDTDESAASATRVDLLGSDLAAGFVGTADVTTESSGVLVRLSMPGLPRRDGDQFYEGWLKSCDGTRLVPIGTFHDMDRAAGWAGVSVIEYPLLTVTAEEVADASDEGQGTSGQVVVTGSISPCPAS
jgi:Anti-sigma-K factor rskA